MPHRDDGSHANLSSALMLCKNIKSVSLYDDIAVRYSPAGFVSFHKRYMVADTPASGVPRVLSGMPQLLLQHLSNQKIAKKLEEKEARLS